ncbi:hypothetical protein T01_12343 [Trichinella spiralis]|uniref:Uncharacterized protein n=1 Tax=Trichinella spiralis TaxID=6334 RepID=A0A0V1BYU2_TRISP|nr:hypothetical protein T01_12343 [Trichinella spiralis]
MEKLIACKSGYELKTSKTVIITCKLALFLLSELVLTSLNLYASRNIIDTLQIFSFGSAVTTLGYAASYSGRLHTSCFQTTIYASECIFKTIHITCYSMACCYHEDVVPGNYYLFHYMIVCIFGYISMFMFITAGIGFRRLRIQMRREGIVLKKALISIAFNFVVQTLPCTAAVIMFSLKSSTGLLQYPWLFCIGSYAVYAMFWIFRDHTLHPTEIHKGKGKLLFIKRKNQHSIQLHSNFQQNIENSLKQHILSISNVKAISYILHNYNAFSKWIIIAAISDPLNEVALIFYSHDSTIH